MNKKNNTSSSPLFFVFTCIKNGRPYIKKLLDSLLVQTEINFVHFIYEDGSDDPVEDIVSEYKEKAKAIGLQVIYEKQEKNIGLNMATKHCIEKCFLPYFLWIDCDNWVDRHFFKELEKGILRSPGSIVYRTNKKIFDSKYNRVVKEMHPLIESKKITFLNNSLLILLNAYYYSFFVVDFNKYLELNPKVYFSNNKLFYNDQQTLFLCSLSNYPFTYLNKSIGYYFRRVGSESLSESILYSNELIMMFKELLFNVGVNRTFDWASIESYYSIKKNWDIAYKERDYLLCKKYIVQKRRLFKKLNVPNYFAHLNENSLLFIISNIFPKQMSNIMKKRDSHD